MLSTMQDHPLLMSDILVHGQRVHGSRSEVVTFEGDGYRRASFAAVAERAERLAAGLRSLGVEPGDRVATLCMNHQEHVEAYLAIPSMGAVLHTLNVRLHPEQLAYVIDDAQDKVIICDSMLAPVLGAVLNQRLSVRDVIVVGEGDVSALGELVIDYEALLASEDPGFVWPVLDERDAAAMCYTSGTTGNPKGVVYSHRSTYLHTMGVTSAATLGISGNDKILIIVPQFHANAWGTPYAAWMAGADMIMPRQFLQPEPLARMIQEERPTLSAGVPTIWADLLRYSESNRVDFSSLREIICGGSAVPQSLMEGFDQRHKVPILQAWGMTETSPLGAVARPPRGTPPDAAMGYRTKTGRVIPGVEIRVVTPDGHVAPWDGQTLGEFEARGPWVTASYYGADDPEKFDNGWLRTGDVGRLDPEGYMQITDRTKDVIKSGGEWISSLDLENELLNHRAVVEAAVVAIPDEKWQERPLAAIVIRGDRPGDADVAEGLARFLVGRVAKWWVPESWTFVKEIPKTTVGKFDKKVLRSQHEAGEMEVFTVDRAVLG